MSIGHFENRVIKFTDNETEYTMVTNPSMTEGTIEVCVNAKETTVMSLNELALFRQLWKSLAKQSKGQS